MLLRGKQRQPRVRHTYTELQGCRIHAITGGSGPPVILLHGLAGSSAWWRYTMPELARHFTTHAPDLVGFGRSRGPLDATIADRAELLALWMDAAALTRAHVIGHSMGAQIAIHLAARFPERVDKLVLVGAAGVPRPIAITQAVRLLAEIIPPRAWGTPRFIPRIAVDTLRAGPFSVARAAASILQDDVRPLLQRISAPTLLVWGALDGLTPLRDGKYMSTQIPNARLLVLEGAAHMPMVDQPRQFNAAVLDFLRE